MSEDLMIRQVLLVALIVITFAHAASSAPIQLIVGLPSSYTPGQPTTFDVRLPAINDLGSFNIDLVLASDNGTAGIDFYFDVAATFPASTNYVFPSSANFVDATNVDSAIRHRLTLTDFDFTGANVAPGTNDRVANVVFQTAPNFAGRLSFLVDAAALILDTPNFEPTPVPDFNAIQAGVAEALPIVLQPVPEPSTISLLVLAVGGICLRLRP